MADQGHVRHGRGARPFCRRRTFLCPFSSLSLSHTILYVLHYIYIYLNKVSILSFQPPPPAPPRNTPSHCLSLSLFLSIYDCPLPLREQAQFAIRPLDGAHLVRANGLRLGTQFAYRPLDGATQTTTGRRLSLTHTDTRLHTANPLYIYIYIYIVCVCVCVYLD